MIVAFVNIVTVVMRKHDLITLVKIIKLSDWSASELLL